MRSGRGRRPSEPTGTSGDPAAVLAYQSARSDDRGGGARPGRPAAPGHRGPAIDPASAGVLHAGRLFQIPVNHLAEFSAGRDDQRFVKGAGAHAVALE